MLNCHCCGHFFIPHPRLGKRQKTCSNTACREKYQKEAKRDWRQNNPDYFKGRYPETKAWREENPDYQSQWRENRREIQDSISSATPLRTLSILVPAKVFKGEIQDSIWLRRKCSCGLWFDGGDREIQDSIGRPESTVVKSGHDKNSQKLFNCGPPSASRRVLLPIEP
jgi:hypothetical protein